MAPSGLYSLTYLQVIDKAVGRLTHGRGAAWRAWLLPTWVTTLKMTPSPCWAAPAPAQTDYDTPPACWHWHRTDRSAVEPSATPYLAGTDCSGRLAPTLLPLVLAAETGCTRTPGRTNNATQYTVSWLVFNVPLPHKYMAISGTKGQEWRAIPTQYRKASDILTATLAAFFIHITATSLLINVLQTCDKVTTW